MTDTKKIAPKKPDGIKLVKMIKDGKSADVHPNEVANFKSAGYVETK